MHFLVVDDDHWSRDGMARTLAEFHPRATLHQARSIAEATASLQAHPEVELVLLDLNLEDSRGLDTLIRLKAWCEAHERIPRIVIVSAAADFDAQILADAIEHCATGFISKGTAPEVFKAAIDLTLAGRVYITDRYLELQRTRPAPSGHEVMFTEREQEVAALLVAGLSYKEVARRLSTPGQDMAETTVRVHVQRMAWKLKAADDALKPLTAKSSVITAFADERWRPLLPKLTRRR